MTRFKLFTTSAIAATVAAPMAFADVASGKVDTHPNIASAGSETPVGSTPTSAETGTQMTDNERRDIGNAEYDPTRMAMPEAEYKALMASVGADFKTSDGVALGTVSGIDFDAQGNPELAVKLLDDTKFEAEKLILTLLPESVELSGDAIIIDESADDLFLAADNATTRGDDSVVNVNIMYRLFAVHGHNTLYRKAAFLPEGRLFCCTTFPLPSP